MKKILTEAIIDIVNAKQKQDNGFGVSIINLPDIDVDFFLNGLQKNRRLELFFLGYEKGQIEGIKKISSGYEDITVQFTVEEAENSRNLGAEDIFRIHFIKNAELEKLSSLRWYDEIDMEVVYKKCCKLAAGRVSQSNDTIKNLLQALARKDIRAVLNFERVLDYLEALIRSTEADLPNAVTNQLFRLGLLSDASFAVGSPNREQIKDSIKKNHSVLRRITNLEQKERQNIANYLAKNPDNTLVRLILDYYRHPQLELLKRMELADVETCLKAVSSSGRTARPPRKQGTTPTVATSEMIFEGQENLIEDFIDQSGERIDERPDLSRNDRITLEVKGIKIDVPVYPSTERLVEIAVSDKHWGGIIEANVVNPKEALDDDKYEFEKFDDDIINQARKYLKRAASFPEAEIAGKAVLNALDGFIAAREKILPFGKRLQDIPMLQVAAKCSAFSDYLSAYERLLSEIKDNF